MRELHVNQRLRRLFRKAARACKTRSCKAILRRDYKKVRAVLTKILPKRVVTLPKRISRVVRRTAAKRASRRAKRASRRASRRVSRRAARRAAKRAARRAARRTRVSRRCKRVQKKRSVLIKQINACPDESARCVRRLFKKVARLNRNRGCKSPKPSVSTRVFVDPLAIPLVDWKKEYTCAGLNKAFKAWMSRQKKVRAYFLHQLHSCQQSDTSCIRGYLRKLVFIHQTNKKGTEEFAHRMTKCDTCALIKVERENG